MAIESEDERNTALLSSVGYGLTDDLLMTEMDTVKEAEREANPAAPQLQFVKVMEDGHPIRRGPASGTG